VESPHPYDAEHVELETIDTPSTIPIAELQDLIDEPGRPPLPFTYEPAIIDIETDDDPQPSISKFLPTTVIRKMREIRIDIKCQGDTGANVGATHDRRILWNYRTLATPIQIITYSKDEDDANSCQAIGVGQCKTISNDNTVMYWTMLHTPQSTGTILSPDKYMMDNKDVESFNHIGNKNGTGSINFDNHEGTTIAAIDMARHQDGLWYTTNPVLMPPHDDTPTEPTATPLRPTVTKTATKHHPQLQTIDEITPTDTVNTTTNVEDTKPTVKLSKSLEQLELWHQRMGHPAQRALQHTTQ
jgi:hypothetical protein